MPKQPKVTITKNETKSNKSSTKPARKPPVEVVEVTIKDLETKYGLEGKQLRVIIRGLGYRAPKTNLKAGELGPTHKYVWMSDSPHLTLIENAIGKFIDTAAALQASEDEVELGR